MSERRKLSSTNYQNQIFLEDKCALNELINILSKRWMTEVLFSIEEGNIRFNSLKYDLKFISDHILASRLKRLEAFAFIEKNTDTENSSKVEYSLTTMGIELSKLLENLCDFAEKITQKI